MFLRNGAPTEAKHSFLQCSGGLWGSLAVHGASLGALVLFCCMLLASIRVPAEIFGGPLVTVSRDFSYSAFWCSRRGGSPIFKVLGSFWGCFLECLGRPLGTLSVPLSSLVGSSGASLHTLRPQGRSFGNL